MRNVTGYTSADSSNNDGVDRVVTKSDFKNTKTSFEADATYEFSLEKTDNGYTAVCNGEGLRVMITHSLQFRKTESCCWCNGK